MSARCPPWRKDLSYGLAWLVHEPQLQTLAVNITKTKTPNQKGLLWALYTPEHYEEKFGAPPDGPIDEVDDFEGNAVDMANQKRQHRIKDAENDGLELLTEIAINSWPEELVQGIMDAGTLIHLSLQEMCYGIREQCPLTTEDFTFLESRLSTPFTGASSSIRAFTASKMNDLALLNANGQTLPDLKAVAAIISCFQATTNDIEDYAHCWADFYSRNGAIEDQTPEQLCAHVNLFVAQGLQHHRRVNSARRTASANAAMAAVTVAASSSAMEAEIQRRVALALASTKKTNAATGTVNKPREQLYCWSCGPTPPHPHTSKRCWASSRNLVITKTQRSITEKEV